MFKKKEILTVPNLISLVRLLLVPVIFILYHFLHQTMITVGVIIFSGLTDVADGWIARKFNMVSDFGKFFDALADKLTEAVTIVLIIPNHIWYVATFVVLLINEGIKLMFGFVALKASDTVNNAKWHGKVNTFVVYVVMITMLSFRSLPLWLEIGLVFLSCSSQIMSLVLYIIFYNKFLKSEKCKKQVKFSYSKYILILVWVIAVIVALLFVNDISISDTLNRILDYTDSNKLVTSLVLLGLFALKSMIFVLHIDLLYIAVSACLPLPWAICVNVLGTLITFIIPYFIAHNQGSNMVEKLTAKYPKVEKITNKRKDNDFMFSFTVRLMGGIPYDIVSYLMGALGVNFVNYLISGIIALIPDIILCQIAGNSMDDPSSPAFIIAVGIKIAKIVISLLILLIITKRKCKKNGTKTEEIEPQPQEEDNGEDYVLIDEDGITYSNDNGSFTNLFKKKNKKMPETKSDKTEELNVNEEKSGN